MKKIIIIGPQGSGKGTQAKKLAEKYSVPHISTGDIFREIVKKGTPLGMKAKKYMDQGLLIPDDIINKAVEERLTREDCKEGFILDGYPRNLDQAEALDSFTEIDFVLELHVPDELSIKRLSSRRQCKECGAIYGISIPSEKEGICDKCGGPLYQRDDDKEIAIKKRLDTYHHKTEPLLEYYKPRDIVHSFDGTKAVDEVLQEICNLIEQIVVQ